MIATRYPLESFLPTGPNWVLRKEWFERQGFIRRRPVLFQLWVDADRDRWALTVIYPKGRKVNMYTGEGIDRLHVKEGDALVSVA